ncbi:putative NADP-dependent oxidoreductase YfmJ [mine drainage metagenome]|uniref:Putative NADP-dependent oxidoreductase YfmJ n=1 Tax=mine drainage metagenome TaxID=410659 RepID=A0A1J5QUE1_9ZZZZ
MNEQNLRITLAGRPQGWPEPEHFRLEQASLPQPGAGQVLVRNRWLSLDPYMRGRMSDAKSYVEPVAIGDVMPGGTVGEVVASNAPQLQVGDLVTGMLGWQRYAAADAAAVRRIDAAGVPPQAFLGALGMPGVTAWYGLQQICRPQAGQTVVVTAASGAVGSGVGQLAKAAGCRVVGVAGGERKCRYAVDELGFDACVDYKAGRLHDDLRDALPDGADCLFENVGGEIFDALLARTRPFARVALCGMIADYNNVEPYRMKNLRAVLVNRLLVQGFIVSEHMELWPQALRELGALAAAGRLRWRETVAEGLEQAPAAFVGMLRGDNLGKQLVRID